MNLQNIDPLVLKRARGLPDAEVDSPRINEFLAEIARLECRQQGHWDEINRLQQTVTTVEQRIAEVEREVEDLQSQRASACTRAILAGGGEFREDDALLHRIVAKQQNAVRLHLGLPGVKAAVDVAKAECSSLGRAISRIRESLAEERLALKVEMARKLPLH